MKKTLLLFALLLPLFGSAQITYHHYLDSSSVWFERTGWAIFNSFPNCVNGGGGERYTRYHIIGWDSLDGEAWHLVHEDWDAVWGCQGYALNYAVSPANNIPTYRIREDSMGNIWTKSDSSPAVLSYAFTPGLTLGDQLWMDDHQYACNIDSIDTLYLGINPRKRYWCACNLQNDTQFIVEGIGYNKGQSNGFFLCNSIYDNDFELVCYGMGSDTLTVSPGYICGRPAHNPLVGSPDPQAEPITVQYLPANEELVLQHVAPRGRSAWQVINMQGQVLRTGADCPARISVAGLPTGIYVFEIRADARIQVLRFYKE
jgi:hypothetical protein